MKKFLSDEKGAAQLIEAAILYPVVFMILFFLIYVGLYMLQAITLESFAQKTAIIAAKEIARPGYINEIGANSMNDAAVELNSSVSLSSGYKFDFWTLYRYCDFISKDKKMLINDDNRSTLSSCVKNMANQFSIIGAKDDVSVEIKPENYFFSQSVTVNVTQSVLEFPVLSFFGIDASQKITASACASVSDTDEFIRNADFIYDCVNFLCKKLGVDLNSITSTISSALDKIGVGK